MRVQVNDFSMAYDDNGGGIPILLIHGFPLNRKMWEPQISGLADCGRLIAPDLRGHGSSESEPGSFSPPAPFTMDLLASDCVSLLDAIGINDPVILCGLSMGGYIALAFYGNYPERVSGIILTATRATPDSPEGKVNREQAIQLAQEKGISAVTESLLPKLLSPNTYANQPKLVQQVSDLMKNISLNGLIGDLLGMKERPDSTSLLPDINIPALLLHGADDQLISILEMDAMREAMPNARLQVLQDAGHLLNLEQPDLFNQAIRNYLLDM
jgi:pimeloyl-ACP methyl ester carboxylesterase